MVYEKPELFVLSLATNAVRTVHDIADSNKVSNTAETGSGHDTTTDSTSGNDLGAPSSSTGGAYEADE